MYLLTMSLPENRAKSHMTRKMFYNIKDASRTGGESDIFAFNNSINPCPYEN